MRKICVSISLFQILQKLIECLDKGEIKQVLFPDSNLIVKVPEKFRQNVSNYLKKTMKLLPKELLSEDKIEIKREKGDKFKLEDRFLSLLFRRNKLVEDADTQLSNIPEEESPLPNVN